MFSISDLSNPRYNGHVQVSSLGKSAGGKRDRKGCTKGKIEAIMKNNPSRPKFCLTGPIKKLTAPVGTNTVFYPSNHTIKSEDQSSQEDPYTFTEPEPQPPSVYHHQQTSTTASVPAKKPVQSSSKLFNMVCTDRTRTDGARVPVKAIKPEAPKTPKAPAESAAKKSSSTASGSGAKRKKVEHSSVGTTTMPIIGLSPGHKKVFDTPHHQVLKRDPNNVIIPAKRVQRKSTWQRERNSKHELLERIYCHQNDLNQYKRDLYPLGLEVSDSDSDDSDGATLSEKYMFAGNDDLPREQRVEATRVQLRRRLAQTLRGLKVSDEPSSDLLSAVVAAARKFPNATAAILDPSLSKKSPPVKKGARFLLTGEKCSYDDCQTQALPATRHCFRHILYNVDQRLFSHCTGPGVDSVQCNWPAFDVRHDQPLCYLHSLHHEPTSLGASESRHRKASKKSRMPGSSRNSKRNNKKRKKPAPALPPPALPAPSTLAPAPATPMVPVPTQTSLDDIRNMPMLSDAIEPTPSSSSSLDGMNPLMPTPILIEPSSMHTLPSHVSTEDIVEEVPEEVLAIANLDPTELANQAARLLEDQDLHILNQISTDAFNDLFTDKNGEYEPTREETEELERALEAVDNDVRSLERMSRTYPLMNPLLNLPLDPMALLDDPAIAGGPFTPFQNGLSTTDISHS
ncbi:INO80 complex subunit D [Nesidiocoris tenuis]|nr:INO80 complex subunit D [Nesidiocoris tenuis]